MRLENWHKLGRFVSGVALGVAGIEQNSLTESAALLAAVVTARGVAEEAERDAGASPEEAVAAGEAFGAGILDALVRRESVH